MAIPGSLGPDEVDAVLQRALKKSPLVHQETSVKDLIEIGKDLGLSPDLVLSALSEYRAEARVTSQIDINYLRSSALLKVDDLQQEQVRAFSNAVQNELKEVLIPNLLSELQGNPLALARRFLLGQTGILLKVTTGAQTVCINLQLAEGARNSLIGAASGIGAVLGWFLSSLLGLLPTLSVFQIPALLFYVFDSPWSILPILGLASAGAVTGLALSKKLFGPLTRQIAERSRKTMARLLVMNEEGATRVSDPSTDGKQGLGPGAH